MSRWFSGVLLITSVFAACSRTDPSKLIAANQKMPILKIAVFADGRFTVDGVQSSLPELHRVLAKLRNQHGAVWYYREAGDHEPPAIASQIMNEIMAVGVPVRLSRKPDYSDSM